MRQLTFVAPGHAEWRETAAPRIESAREAIVRPLVLGRCDLDAAYMRGLAPMAAGEPIGHEMIGEVIEVGDAVTRIQPGMRAIVSAQINCGHCRKCRLGLTGRCESVPFGASYGMGRAGGYGCAAADLVRVPFADAMLVPLPDNADPVALIGAADMAADSWRAVAPQLAERPGARVLVMGGLASVIGIYAAGLAVTLGASDVAYADTDSARRAQAVRYGARAIELPGDLGGPYEIVVDAAGSVEALHQALRAAEPEALVTGVVIHFGATTPLPLLDLYMKGAHIRFGRANCRAQHEPLLACCLHQGFRPDLIDTSRHEFDDAPAAWADPAIRAIAVRD